MAGDKNDRVKIAPPQIEKEFGNTGKLILSCPASWDSPSYSPHYLVLHFYFTGFGSNWC